MKRRTLRPCSWIRFATVTRACRREDGRSSHLSSASSNAIFWQLHRYAGNATDQWRLQLQLPFDLPLLPRL